MICRFLLRNFADNISYASYTKKQIVIILGKILLTRKTSIQWPQVQIKHSNNYSMHITCCIFKTISLVYFYVSANLLHSSKDYFCRQIIRSLESHSKEEIRHSICIFKGNLMILMNNNTKNYMKNFLFIEIKYLILQST